jgi:hypothetical protein
LCASDQHHSLVGEMSHSESFVLVWNPEAVISLANMRQHFFEIEFSDSVVAFGLTHGIILQK